MKDIKAAGSVRNYLKILQKDFKKIPREVLINIIVWVVQVLVVAIVVSVIFGTSLILSIGLVLAGLYSFLFVCGIVIGIFMYIKCYHTQHGCKLNVQFDKGPYEKLME